MARAGGGCWFAAGLLLVCCWFAAGYCWLWLDGFGRQGDGTLFLQERVLGTARRWHDGAPRCELVSVEGQTLENLGLGIQKKLT